MNRKRKTAKGLPQRVYKKHGAYYFVPTTPCIDPRTPKGPVKAWIRLCSINEDLTVLYTELAKVLGTPRHSPGSMPYCCDEYKREELPTLDYGDDTVATYGAYLDLISHRFEDFHCTEVTTKDCADFLKKQYKGKPNTAKKVKGLLTRLFRYIIADLGMRQDNPVDQLELKEKTSRRMIIPTHGQIAAIRSAGMQSTARKVTGHVFDNLSGPTFACIIDMTYLIWQRGVDIRTMRDPKDHPTIRITPTKTSKTSGKAVDIEITPAIRAVVERAQAIKREHHVVSAYLFPALAGEHKGHPYTKSGLSSMWRRAKARAELDDMNFQFKDIRALGATDAAKAGASKEDIRKRLVHTTTKTSEVYIKEVIPEVSGLDVKLPWAQDGDAK